MTAGDFITMEEMSSLPAVEEGGEPAAPAPRASVLMLARNHGEYLREAVESVLGQEGCSFELLIGEDGSSDATLALCREFKLLHPDTVRLVTAPGQVGMHRNFARLWVRARGEFVAVCEGDDYWTDAGKLAKQAGYLENHPRASMCAAWTRMVRRTADGGWESCGEVVPPEMKDTYAVEDLIPSYSFHTSSVMVRKSMIRFPRWLWRVYCVDRPLYLLAAEQGEVACLPEFMSVYRLQEGGAWVPLPGIEKARNGMELFAEIDRHFGGRHHRLIRGTLAAIIWSYMGQALNAGDRRSARRLYLLMLRHAFPALPAPPLLMAKAALRCCLP